MSDRPRVGVSACLLGERVRYDAGHKRDAWLVDELGRDVEWVPVCPEVEAGLGTPREAMQLERQADGRLAMMTVQTRRDLTDTMHAYSIRRVEELAQADLDGYVFKAGSPSCAVDGDRGIFAEAFTRRMPDVPVEDERRLADPATRRMFVERVLTHFRGRRRGLRLVEIVRVRGSQRQEAADRAAAEEPLEIRLHGRPFATIMRTPGADLELAAGFLLAERVIASGDDLGTIEYCTEKQPQSAQRAQSHVFSAISADSAVASNVVNVTLVDPARVEQALADRRALTTNASCGVCGRRTIESLAAGVRRIETAWTMTSAAIASLPPRLRQAQAVFDETGGLHAAGLFTPAGALVDVAEDVGRHNAVDKLTGRMLMRDALPLDGYALCVSGRTSFEIVQKAIVAGVPIVAAVSAPSSLAIDLARDLGVTLIGFVRGDGFNIYTHPDRIAG